MKYRTVFVFLAAAGTLAAQQIKFPPALDKLAERASETVNVTLGPEMLGFASKFLSEGKKDEAAAKKIVTKLTGIYVRSFEFEKEGEYDEKIIEEIRSQLKTSDWSRIVEARSKKDRETAEIYINKGGGLLILAAEPKEFTVVNLVGQISPDDVGSLTGQFGIPKMDLSPSKPSTTKKEEE
jgi:hypothetical protein